MKKRVVVQMEGGLGKQVALTALISYFKENYEQLIVLSSYPDVFINNPNVYRAISYTTPYAYEEYFKTADDIVYPCGYRDTNFRKRRIHLIEAACNSINISYNKEMKPELYSNLSEETQINEIKEKLGNYIIIQANGAPNVMARDYDINKMAEVVKNIKELYPDLSIINYSLPGATEIAGTIKMNFPTPIWFALVRECETFIVVDSSLQHMSAAYDKKGVVLWGSTNPTCFGWSHNINLTGKCLYADTHCTRPYFVPSVDFKGNGEIWVCPTKNCMKIKSEEIFEAFKTITINIDRKPNFDLTPFISLETKMGETK